MKYSFRSLNLQTGMSHHKCALIMIVMEMAVYIQTLNT